MESLVVLGEILLAFELSGLGRWLTRCVGPDVTGGVVQHLHV